MLRNTTAKTTDRRTRPEHWSMASYSMASLLRAVILFVSFTKTVIFANGDVSSIRYGPVEQRARTRSTVSLRCTADVESMHFGTPEIEWRKDNEVLDLARDDRLVVQLNGQFLTIMNASTADTGLYSCIARLSDRRDITSARLVVEDVPDPPTGVQLTACDGRVVQLEWRLTNDNHSPVVQFIIEYNTSFRPDDWQVAKNQLPPDRTYQRLALSPWGNYSFRVIAENGVGMSRPSAPTATACSTAPDVPHINPKVVCTLNEKPRTLVVSWESMPEKEHNAPGFSYLVRWRKHEAKPQEYVDTPVDKKSNTLRIEGQPVYVPYEILVIARNEIGDAVSPPKMIIGYSGEDVPSEAPQHFRLDPNKEVSDRTADFVWTPVSTGPWIIRGFFRGYKIQFWKKDDPSTMREHSIIYREPGSCWMVPVNARQKREASLGHIYNLWPFTNITAQIRVLNAKYEGPSSNQITFTTKEGVPGPPSHLVVTERGHNLLSLSWERPATLNGIFLGYTLIRTVVNPKDQDHSKDQVVHISESNQPRTMLKDLLPNRTYRISVAGRTNAGLGPSVVTESRTLPKLPPSKLNFTTVILNKRSLNVSWFMLQHDTPATCFLLRYHELGKSRWNSSRCENGKNWTVIEGLEPGVVYEVQIVARNGHEGDFLETSSPVRRVTIGMKRDLIQPTFKVVYPDSSSVHIVLERQAPYFNDFYVEYRPFSSAKWRKAGPFRVKDVAPIRDLVPGSKYEIRVIARSDLGEAVSFSTTIVIGKPPDAQASVGSDNGSSSYRLLNDVTFNYVIVVTSLVVTNFCAGET